MSLETESMAIETELDGGMPPGLHILSEPDATALEATALETTGPGAKGPEQPSLPKVYLPLQLRPGIRIAESESTTYVGLGEIDERWLKLSGAGLGQLLGLLNGRFTTDALLGAIPDSRRPALKTLLAQLRESDLLEPWADGSLLSDSNLGKHQQDRIAEHRTVIRALDGLAKRLAFGDLDGLALFEILRQAEVDVVAPSTLAAAMNEALGSYGIQTRSTLNHHDLVIVMATPATADEQFKSFDEQNNLEQDRLEQGRPEPSPWLPVVIEALDLRFGPIINPQEGPCYRCFQHRRAANQPIDIEIEPKLIHSSMDDRPPAGTLRLGAELAALEAIRFLVSKSQSETPELQGRIKDVRLPDLVSETHHLLPIPFCSICHKAADDKAAVQEARPTPPALPGNQVFDPLCGIVKTCLSVPVQADDPKIFFIATEATDSTRLGVGIPEASRFGCGVDVSEDAAKGAAMGEILERYSAAHYDPSEIRFCNFEQLKEEATAPESFALFSAEQYQRFAGLPHPFTRNTKTGWVRGISLVDERPIWVPASFVYLPYRYRAQEAYLGDCLSTGISCGLTREAAILNSLYEVVERDTTSITWHARLEPSRLHLDPDSELGRLYEDLLSTPEMELRLLDLTLDLGIPTVAAFLLHEKGGTVVGSATRLDPRAAARKALLEAVQGQLVWKQWLREGPKHRFAPDFHDVLDYADHPRAYMAPEMRSRLDFLWASPDSRPIEEIRSLPAAGSGRPEDQLSACIDALSSVGLEPIVVDVTSPDVRKLGYWVMRVLIPGMQPLNARHDAPYFGGSRLYQVPQRLGLRRHPITGQELSSDPHPFP